MEEVKNDTRNIGVIEEAMLDRDKSFRQKVRNARLLISAQVYVLVDLGEKMEKYWERLKRKEKDTPTILSSLWSTAVQIYKQNLSFS